VKRWWCSDETVVGRWRGSGGGGGGGCGGGEVK
jgi:hypothetical protein